MMFSNFASGLQALLLYGVLLPLVGCAPRESSSKDQSEIRDRTESVIRNIERAFEREDDIGLSRYIHPDFDDGRVSSPSGLRSQLRRVFSSYNRIRLDVYGIHYTRSKNTISAGINWNLSWVCQKEIIEDLDGDGQKECTKKSQVILRKGRTTFVFRKDDEELKLISQRGNHRLLGNRAPGNEQKRS